MRCYQNKNDKNSMLEAEKHTWLDIHHKAIFPMMRKQKGFLSCSVTFNKSKMFADQLEICNQPVRNNNDPETGPEMEESLTIVEQSTSLDRPQ